MKKYFTFLSLFFCLLNVDAQPINSLLQKIKSAPEDINKVRLLYKIGSYYKSNNFDSACLYLNEGKRLCEKLAYSEGEMDYYLNMHGAYLENGKYDSSLIMIQKGLLLFKKSITKMQLANSYENISSSYHYLLKFDSCTRYDLLAQAIYEAADNKKELMIFYGNLCGSYNERHLFDKAKEYGLKALALNKQGFGDDNDLVYVLNNLCTVYIYLNQSDSAIYYGKRCVELCKKENNYSVGQIILENMMLVLINQHKYKELMPMVAQLKEMGKKVNTNEYDARLNFNYAMAYYYNGQAKLAKEYAQKALVISIPNQLSVISKNTFILLDKVEAILGNYALADLYGEKRDSINNVQMNEETAKNIQELEKKYETQKKENEILLLREENQKKTALNIFFLGTAIAFLLVGFLGYRNFKNKQKVSSQQQELQQQKIAELEKDKQLLAIDAMLKGQEDERSRIAKDLHDGLGGMLSGVKLSFVNMKENMIMDAESVLSFEKSIMQLDNTITELRKVAHNLMPEALVKFGLNNAVADFCNAMQLASKIKIIFEPMGIERQLSNTADLYIYRIIQELVNNAIKHAAPNQILVQLTKSSDKVLLTVEDDGKGFHEEILDAVQGMGWKNLQQRIDYFKGKIELITGAGEGTSVNIELIA